MAESKRTYSIPLRKDFSKVPPYRRAKRAVAAVKAFLKRHMKGEVRLGRRLNMFIWERGVRNPPHHVTVEAVKDDKNIVKAELPGFVYEEKKSTQLEKGKIQETLEMLKGKKEEPPKQEDAGKNEVSETQEEPPKAARQSAKTPVKMPPRKIKQ